MGCSDGKCISINRGVGFDTFVGNTRGGGPDDYVGGGSGFVNPLGPKTAGRMAPMMPRTAGAIIRDKSGNSIGTSGPDVTVAGAYPQNANPLSPWAAIATRGACNCNRNPREAVERFEGDRRPTVDAMTPPAVPGSMVTPVPPNYRRPPAPPPSPTYREAQPPKPTYDSGAVLLPEQPPAVKPTYREPPTIVTGSVGGKTPPGTRTILDTPPEEPCLGMEGDRLLKCRCANGIAKPGECDQPYPPLEPPPEDPCSGREGEDGRQCRCKWGTAKPGECDQSGQNYPPLEPPPEDPCLGREGNDLRKCRCANGIAKPGECDEPAPPPEDPCSGREGEDGRQCRCKWGTAKPGECDQPAPGNGCDPLDEKCRCAAGEVLPECPNSFDNLLDNISKLCNPGESDRDCHCRHSPEDPVCAKPYDGTDSSARQMGGADSGYDKLPSEPVADQPTEDLFEDPAKGPVADTPTQDDGFVVGPQEDLPKQEDFGDDDGATFDSLPGAIGPMLKSSVAGALFGQKVAKRLAKTGPRSILTLDGQSVSKTQQRQSAHRAPRLPRTGSPNQSGRTAYDPGYHGQSMGVGPTTGVSRRQDAEAAAAYEANRRRVEQAAQEAADQKAFFAKQDAARQRQAELDRAYQEEQWARENEEKMAARDAQQKEAAWLAQQEQYNRQMAEQQSSKNAAYYQAQEADRQAREWAAKETAYKLDAGARDQQANPERMSLEGPVTGPAQDVKKGGGFYGYGPMNRDFGSPFAIRPAGSVMGRAGLVPRTAGTLTAAEQAQILGAIDNSQQAGRGTATGATGSTDPNQIWSAQDTSGFGCPSGQSWDQASGRCMVGGRSGAPGGGGGSGPGALDYIGQLGQLGSSIYGQYLTGESRSAAVDLASRQQTLDQEFRMAQLAAGQGVPGAATAAATAQAQIAQIQAQAQAMIQQAQYQAQQAAAAQNATPTWVMPAAVGGGALLLLFLLKNRKGGPGGSSGGLL